MKGFTRAAAWILMILAPVVTARAADRPVPEILRADADSTLSNLFIYGVNFGTREPIVTLSGTPLSVASFTSAEIVALLPSHIDAATFKLQVATTDLDRGDRRLTSEPFEVTLGAVGPPGPAGPKARPARPVRQVPPVPRARKGVRHATCWLEAAGNEIRHGAMLGPFLGAASVQTVAFNLVQTLGTAGNATVHCAVGDIVDNIKAFSTNISAIKVGP